ncbi:conserved hypothetical protein [delta proteobacterium NaphS2]|nr:conserved hypothetical protein [delta proteobacterium NaphS2]
MTTFTHDPYADNILTELFKNQLVVRPVKVAYFSGCESRPGRLASHWVVSPWIDGSNPRD